MTTQDNSAPRSKAEVDHDLIVDRIYEIAVEPTALDGFINFWHDAQLEAQMADNAPDTPKTRAYQTHLERAETILQRSETARPDLTDYLIPYDNLAAFMVSRSLRIEVANSGALAAFGARAGDMFDQLRLPEDMHTALAETIREVLRSAEQTERLLKADIATKGGAMLFRVLRLADALDGGPAALVISTHFHWRERIGTLLGNVFGLTQAEQEVVRLLIEGKDAKTVATTRNTSEGTVRGQIKAILAKMNLRSQADIIRLVMTLGDFPKGDDGAAGSGASAAPELSSNWLEAEVWKPFKTLDLPEGRALTYHDIGPPTGQPILLSHMGSCMVRWPRAMVRMAFERQLRILCPVRAGYGTGNPLAAQADPIETARSDTLALLDHLGIARLPYAVQGTDFLFAADLAAAHPERVSEVIGIGARPCLPDGVQVVGIGRWQRFFVSTARNSPQLVQFASRAVMAMCKRIGPDAMLRQLCKDSAADLALLEQDDVKQVLTANLSLMAGKTTNAARAFALEFIAFQKDWSDRVHAINAHPLTVYIAEEDPTFDLAQLPTLREAYPWITFETLENAGLALLFQRPDILVPHMAEAARRAGR